MRKGSLGWIAILTFIVGFVATALLVALLLLWDVPATDVLFGASTVALTVVGIVLAALAVYNWMHFREIVRSLVHEEAEYEKAANKHANAAVYGVLTEYFLIQRENRGFLLNRAIAFERSALRTDAFERSEVGQHAKNNLAYVLALRSWYEEKTLDRGPRRADAREAIELVRKMWASVRADEYRALKAMTLARVYAEFARFTEERPVASLRKARALLNTIMAEEALNEFEKREMAVVRRRLEEALQEAAKIPDRSETVGGLARRLWRAIRRNRWR